MNMDCNAARQLLDFARPGITELDASDIAELEMHLADCESCAQFARAERRSDDLLASAMQDVVMPPGARGRLLARADQARSTWWRKRLAVATVAIASVGAGWWLYPAPRLDADTIASIALERFGNQSAAEEWLAQQNRHFGFPPRFKAKYLVGFETRDYHGVTAPVLTFVKRNSLARVVVLAEKQFRELPGVADGSLAENSVATILVIHDPVSAGVVYLVEVLNGPIDPFYVDEEPAIT